MMVRKSKGLSERHRKILEFLESHQNKFGYPPSIREIGEKTGISSTSVVNYYLDQLEKMGYIERDRRISRGVRLTDKLTDTVQGVASTAKGTAAALHNAVEELLRIPVLGRIAAGEPIPVPASTSITLMLKRAWRSPAACFPPATLAIFSPSKSKAIP